MIQTYFYKNSEICVGSARRQVDKPKEETLAKILPVGVPYEVGKTALILSGNIKGEHLLALKCLEQGLLGLKDSFCVVYFYVSVAIKDKPGWVMYQFHVESEVGSKALTFDLKLPKEDFLALQLPTEQYVNTVPFILTQEEGGVCFYYEPCPYFTKKIPITLTKEVRQQIEKASKEPEYVKHLELLRKIEPDYLGGITQTCLVLDSVFIDYDDSKKELEVFGKDLEFTLPFDLPYEEGYVLYSNYIPVLWVIDEEGKAALYY